MEKKKVSNTRNYSVSVKDVKLTEGKIKRKQKRPGYDTFQQINDPRVTNYIVGKQSRLQGIDCTRRGWSTGSESFCLGSDWFQNL